MLSGNIKGLGYFIAAAFAGGIPFLL